MTGGKSNSGLARPLRVLHFVSTFAVKTDTKLLARMAHRLNRSRCEWAFACFYGDGPMRRVLEDAGCLTFNLDMPSQTDPRAILRAERVIGEYQPDVVHTHLLRADLFAGMAARLAGVRTIVGAAYAIGAFRRERKRWSDPLLDSVCARLPTHFVAVSHAAKRDWCERLNLSPERISVIHTGVEATPAVDPAAVRSFREQLGANDDTPLIVTVARLSYEKGIDTLLAAAAHLRDAGVRFRWAVVGDGPDRDRVFAHVRDAGLTNHVFFTGFREDTWPAIAAADAFCIPSKSEAFPVVMLEAMAAGRAIVATRVGGIPEAITQNANGVLIEPNAPQAMADALSNVLADRELAGRLGQAASATVKQRFDASRVAQQYVELYERLVSAEEVADAAVALA